MVLLKVQYVTNGYLKGSILTDGLGKYSRGFWDPTAQIQHVNNPSSYLK